MLLVMYKSLFMCIKNVLVKKNVIDNCLKKKNLSALKPQCFQPRKYVSMFGGSANLLLP